MARRRAQARVGPADVPDLMPPSARVAWSYLAVILALVVAGVLVAIGNQTVATLSCPAESGLVLDDAAAVCRLGVGIWVAIIGFLVCLLPALVLVKLDVWLWLAALAGTGFLVAADATDQWWWWGIAALVPAAAALASAHWSQGAVFRRWQLGLILALDVAAVVVVAFWYLHG